MLAELHKAGILTDEEFATQKARILACSSRRLAACSSGAGTFMSGAAGSGCL